MARSDIWVRRAGFACGVAVVGTVLAAARVPAQPRDLGLDLRVAPAPSSTLTVKPLRPLLVASGMRPGSDRGQASGSATVVNPSSKPQRVRIRALPSTHALDRGLQVELRLAGKLLYRGPVAELRKPTQRSLVLTGGNAAPLSVRVKLLDGAHGWRGRIEDVDLAFDGEPVATP